MSSPQQPELRRSGRGDVTQEGRREAREQRDDRSEQGPTGPVPPDNQPGHHPEHEQDRPDPDR
ncbi:MAG: hypothetical protein ACJ76A_11500 [Actinomycetota bacterium]